MATKMEKTPRKARESKVDPNETKAQKFARLASLRTSKLIKTIRSMKKLGANNYERTQEQVDKIVNTLKQEVDSLALALKPGKKASGASDVNFTL